MNHGNFIVDAFIDRFCRFTKTKFDDGSDDWLYETEPFLLLGLRKWVAFQGCFSPKTDLISRFMERCVSKGFKDVHLDKSAKILNFRGAVVFGFRFTEKIYELVKQSDKLKGPRFSDPEEVDQFTDNFIQRHLVYQSKHVERVAPIFDLYCNALGFANIAPHNIDSFLPRCVHLIPQVKIIGSGKNGELLNVVYSLSGFNHDKIQNILNKERAAIDFKI